MAASVWTLQLHTVSVPPGKTVDYAFRKRRLKKLDVLALGDGRNIPDQVMVVKSEKRNLPVLLQHAVFKLQETVKSLPPATLLVIALTLKMDRLSSLSIIPMFEDGDQVKS
ncbi:hypothetical protein FXO37_23973 [Capsicum annuum]|nr:hypothetical protein FXO37_23973 [Capsicum annuum]